MIKQLSYLSNLVALQSKRKKLILAAAQDAHSIEAAYQAWKDEIVDIVLVGDKAEIEKIANQKGLDISAIELIDVADKAKAVEVSVKLIRDGKGDILMKGNVPTSTLLKGVLDKEWGLRKGGVLSHFALFEIPAYHKLLGLTDVAMNIAPDLQGKAAILNNAVSFMNSLGFEKPKVAALAAVETVNSDMQATLDAAMLSKMAQRGQLGKCIVDGPLAFDNAISRESAEHKGIISDVAGDADLLLFPNIESGNVIYKALSYFANARLAAVILGAKAPIVLTSRADSEDAKLNSILLAAVGK